MSFTLHSSTFPRKPVDPVIKYVCLLRYASTSDMDRREPAGDKECVQLKGKWSDSTS